jgi:DNA modification methylase
MLGGQGRDRSLSPGGLRLSWPGRSWEPGAPLASSLPQLAHPAVTTETFAGGAEGNENVRLIHGDALDVVGALLSEGMAGKVDLVYVDPPFASQAAYTYEARLDGPADGRVLRARAYDDRWAGEGVAHYLDMLAPRLDALARLLAPRGTIWVHVDYRASYLVRLVLDEALGRRAFMNEIVWRRAPNLGRQAASDQFGRTLDTLVVYGGKSATLKPPTRLEPIAPAAVRRDDEGRPFTAAPRGDYTDESIERLAREGRVHRTASGKVYVKYFLVQDGEGAWCRERRVDALWTDVPPLRHARTGERTGFPTQKPRALLDRIVACASPPGGLVVDLFAGSGTTAESAHALGRRCLLGDSSPIAVAMARARLLRGGVPIVVQRCGAARAPQAAPPRVLVERRGEKVRVELLAPTEPLAWAVNLASDIATPSRTVWHSERTPGARTRAALREASLESAGDRLGVTVWHDDGSTGTCIVEAP